jgi:ABC-type transport system substrate-binding protein
MTVRNEKIIAVTLVLLMLAGGLGFIPSLANAQDEELVLKVGIIGDPENLNPILAWSELAWILIGLMYEPLVRWEMQDDGSWISAPGMAESWEWADNGTQVTFHLYEDATWHDGTPFTAYDVNWTLFTWTWLGWWAASTTHIDHNSIVIIDDYTVALNFVEYGYLDIPVWDPVPLSVDNVTPNYHVRDLYDDTPAEIAQDYFLKSIPYLPMFPKHMWDPLMWNDPVFGTEGSASGYILPNGTFISAPYWDSFWYDQICWGVLDPTWAEPRIGTGPFVFDEWVPGEYLRLTTNENYHKGRANIDALEFVIYSTIETMTQGVVVGDIDVCQTSITYTELSQFGDDITVMENDFMGIRVLEINQYESYLNASQEYEGRGAKHNALLEDAVRKAIHQAVNKTRLAEVAYLGTARAADSSIHDTLVWHNDNMVEFTYGTAAAMATLEGAGWELNADGVWEKDMGGYNETLSFTLKYESGDPISFTEAQLAEEDLENAGFDITTVPVEATTYIYDMTTGTWNFELTITFWTQLMDPNYYIWYHRSDSGLNPVDIQVPRIDEIFHLQQTTQDFTARKALVDEFQQIMYDESSVIPLLYYKDVEIYRSDRWTFIDDDYTSGVYGLLNYFAFITVEEAEALPPPELPIEMIALVGGAAAVVILLAVFYMKRR